MDGIEIEGGVALQGEVNISGAKNAALPMLCASLLAEGEHICENVPDLRDIGTMGALLRHLGVEVQVEPSRVRMVTSRIESVEAPYDLVKKMRASVLVLGPLVARHGRARVSLPGGCAIGARPIDQHLRGLEAMGAEITLEHGYVDARVPAGRLRGAAFRFDMITVTGTENLMAAATLAEGTTVLENAAREPEVQDFAVLLNKMGARIRGAGSPTIEIEGCDSLHAVEHGIMPDRIETGTYMIAGAITGGDVLVKRCDLEHVHALVGALRAAGVHIERETDGIRVRGEGDLGPVNVTTEPHPGFPTDMQAQFMSLMSLAQGRSEITETIFENRFMHVSELQRMGARIRVRGRTATVEGVGHLDGATVMATDLRASASLVLAGLAARGTTEVRRVYHLDRGYEAMERKLQGLGARVRRVMANA